MIKIIKFSYTTSLLIFTVALLYVYALLPQKAGVFYNELGVSTMTTSKEYVFYIALAVFVLINGLIYAVKQINISQVNLFISSIKDMSKQEAMYHWLTGLAFSLNLILIFSVCFFGIYHNKEYININHYAVLIYLGPLFLLGWLIWFVYLKLVKN